MQREKYYSTQSKKLQQWLPFNYIKQLHPYVFLNVTFIYIIEILSSLQKRINKNIDKIELELLQGSQLDIVYIIENMCTITTFQLTLSKKNQYVKIRKINISSSYSITIN